MIPYWYFLIGLLPIIVIMIPNNRKHRIFLGCVIILVFFIFWGGISKQQAIEREFVQWTLEDLAKRSKNGQNNAVCSAICIYIQKTDRKKPFNGFEFRDSIKSHIEKQENTNPNKSLHLIDMSR